MMDDGLLQKGGLFKHFFNEVMSRGVRVKRSLIFHEISILKSWWTESDWSFPSMNLRLAQNKLRPWRRCVACFWKVDFIWFPLHLTVINRSPLKKMKKRWFWDVLLFFASTFHWKLPCVGFGFDLLSTRNYLHNGSKSLALNSWNCQGEFGKLMQDDIQKPQHFITLYHLT